MTLYNSAIGLMVVGVILLVFSGFHLLRQGTDMAHDIMRLVFIAGVAVIIGGLLMIIFIKSKK
jgi:hypothetical protein